MINPNVILSLFPLVCTLPSYGMAFLRNMPRMFDTLDYVKCLIFLDGNLTSNVKLLVVSWSAINEKYRSLKD